MILKHVYAWTFQAESGILLPLGVVVVAVVELAKFCEENFFFVFYSYSHEADH